MWIYLAFSSAIILGFYDICKKKSVQQNAVIPVLFLTTFFGSIAAALPAVLSRTHPAIMKSLDLFVPTVPAVIHVLIFAKSLLVTLAWIFGYFALKHLPISIVTPIRAGGPFFTLIGALVIFNEQPGILQWTGFIIILASLLFMSKIGKLEGIDLKNNRWLIGALFGTFLSSCSSLYDKYLLQYQHIHPQLLLTWFSVYMVLILLIVLLTVWYPKRLQYTRLKWRWSIPLVGLLLVTADALYFRALHTEGALILIVSAVKRFRVFIAVLIGGVVFKERNKRKKSLALAGIVTGVLLIMLSKYIL